MTSNRIPHQRRRAVLVAAAVALVVAGAAVTIGWTGGRPAGRARLGVATARPAAPPRSPASARPAPRSRAPSRSSAPGPPRVPQVSLAGLRWAGFHGVQLPAPPTAGPRVSR